MPTKISQIDQQIDANRAELLRRVRLNLRTAHDWQIAWDQNPDLSLRERDLFRQRGVAQQERDAKAHKDWMSENRLARRQHTKAQKQCPTCGFQTLTA